MSKVIGTLLRILFFMIAWKVVMSFLPSLGEDSTTTAMVINAFMKLIATFILSAVFWLTYQTAPFARVKNVGSGLRTGLVSGLIFTVLAIVLPCVTSGYDIAEFNSIHGYGIWFIYLIINLIIQELIIRGYLYELIKSSFNTGIAMVLCMALYLAMYSNIYQYGLFSLMIILAMNLCAFSLLEYTQSIWSVVGMRVIWQGIAGIIFGLLPTMTDYPQMCEVELLKNDMITGGSMLLDGSGFVFLLYLIFAVVYLVLSRKAGKS